MLKLKELLFSTLSKLEVKILNLLDDDRVDYKVALVFCRQFNFQPGLIKLLTAGPVANLSDLLSVYLDAGLHRDARDICTEHGFKNTDLWRKALLFWSARANNEIVAEQLKKSLPTAIKSLPLISIVMLLKDSNAPISIIKRTIFIVFWDFELCENFELFFLGIFNLFLFWNFELFSF